MSTGERVRRDTDVERLEWVEKKNGKKGRKLPPIKGEKKKITRQCKFHAVRVYALKADASNYKA